jgi:hypothetical protein
VVWRKSIFFSRNTIPTSDCNKCLGENYWRFPPKSLGATSSTIRGLLFTMYIRRVAETTGRRTIGNAQKKWVKHDGAPAHSSRDVMRYLDSHYPGQCIGRNGPVVWPPQSPDLTPADFYLRGHLKCIFYAQRCNKRDELWNSIEVAGTTIRNMPGGFQRTRNPWRNKARLCIDCNDGPFQYSS